MKVKSVFVTLSAWSMAFPGVQNAGIEDCCCQSCVELHSLGMQHGDLQPCLPVMLVASLASALQAKAGPAVRAARHDAVPATQQAASEAAGHEDLEARPAAAPKKQPKEVSSGKYKFSISQTAKLFASALWGGLLASRLCCRAHVAVRVSLLHGQGPPREPSMQSVRGAHVAPSVTKLDTYKALLCSAA